MPPSPSTSSMTYRPAKVVPTRGSCRCTRGLPSTKQNVLSFGYLRWHCSQVFMLAGPFLLYVVRRDGVNLDAGPHRDGTRSRCEMLLGAGLRFWCVMLLGAGLRFRCVMLLGAGLRPRCVMLLGAGLRPRLRRDITAEKEPRIA